MADDDLLGDELICVRTAVLDGRDPRSDAHGRDCGADPQPLRELKPRSARRRSDRRRAADFRPDAIRELRGGRVVLGMAPDARAQGSLAGEYRAAGLAPGE